MKIISVTCDVDYVYENHIQLERSGDWKDRLEVGDIVLYLDVEFYGATLVLHNGRLGWVDEGLEFFRNHCIEI